MSRPAGSFPFFISKNSICIRCSLQLQRQSRNSRSFASKQKKVSNVLSEADEDQAKRLPRWAVTPSAMKAPYKARKANENDEYPVNEDPKLLEQAYDRLLGSGGASLLSEEVRWLAVTHKSFDHGRRGFNERLALLGRRILNLQASIAMLNAPNRRASRRISKDTKDYGRQPFEHEAYAGLQNVSYSHKASILNPPNMASLAERCRLAQVVRWKPAQVRDLKASGQEEVLASALYAIIGAVALQKGGEIANQIARHRILAPLGLP